MRCVPLKFYACKTKSEDAKGKTKSQKNKTIHTHTEPHTLFRNLAMHAHSH